MPAPARLCVLLTFLWLLSQSERRNGASASPVPQLDWTTCKEESGGLYNNARRLYETHNESSLNFSAGEASKPPRIRCSDKCDPGSLIKDKMVCLQRVHLVLHWYRSALQHSNVFANNTLTKSVRQSLKNLEDFLQAVTGQNFESMDFHTKARWHGRIIAENVTHHLLGFSIMVTRIFYPGDPAKHQEH